MKIQKKKKSKNVEFYRVEAFWARPDRSTGAVIACKSLLEASGRNSVAPRFYTYSSMRPEGSTDWNSINSAINVALKLLGKQSMTPPRGRRTPVKPEADTSTQRLTEKYELWCRLRHLPYGGAQCTPARSTTASVGAATPRPERR
ncbi:unnamed protein product [Cuscuta europaea]|uniref:Uncharacterized protein n=1 Tax=Cuscuta europaea TaxID=41803 RepID=A0A9P0YIW5_CUSEU|nr:unnamed protein product [Cuscuta europaea]